LFVTGRLKDVLRLHRRTLYPQDVEHELMRRHKDSNALRSAIFTVAGDGDDPHDGASVVVIQEIRGRLAEERAQEITLALERTVTEQFGLPVPTVILVRPGVVQRTTSGKVRRALMRENYVANLLSR
jgi:acyl-CoA synthetase (AMP-forming)/AMP-acid ligase II